MKGDSVHVQQSLDFFSKCFLSEVGCPGDAESTDVEGQLFLRLCCKDFILLIQLFGKLLNGSITSLLTCESGTGGAWACSGRFVEWDE